MWRTPVRRVAKIVDLLVAFSRPTWFSAFAGPLLPTVAAQAVSAFGNFLFVSSIARTAELSTAAAILTVVAMQALVSTTFGATLGQLSYLREDAYRGGLHQPDLARAATGVSGLLAIVSVSVALYMGQPAHTAVLLGGLAVGGGIWGQARFQSFAHKRATDALVGDLVWTTPIALVWAARLSPTVGVAVYSLAPFLSVVATSAGRALLWSVVRGTTTVRVSRRQTRDLFIESLVGAGTLQILFLLVGAIAGATVLAGMRAGFGIVGPFSVLASGIALWFGPHISALYATGEIKSANNQARDLTAGSIVLVLAMVVFTGTRSFADIGEYFLGAVWPVARALTPFLVAVIGIRAAAVGAVTVLKVSGRTEELARVRTIESGLSLITVPLVLSVATTSWALTALVVFRTLGFVVLVRRAGLFPEGRS